MGHCRKKHRMLPQLWDTPLSMTRKCTQMHPSCWNVKWVDGYSKNLAEVFEEVVKPDKQSYLCIWGNRFMKHFMKSQEQCPNHLNLAIKHCSKFHVLRFRGSLRTCYHLKRFRLALGPFHARQPFTMADEMQHLGFPSQRWHRWHPTARHPNGPSLIQ